MIFADVTRVYLDYVKENCTETYWKRQEAILGGVLPRLGKLSCLEAINTLLPELEKKGRSLEDTPAIDAVQDVIGWALKSLSPDFLVSKTDCLNPR